MRGAGEDACDETLGTAVRRHVLAVYERHDRNKAATAAALGVCLKTLYTHLHRLESAGHVRAVPAAGDRRYGFDYLPTTGGRS